MRATRTPRSHPSEREAMPGSRSRGPETPPHSSTSVRTQPVAEAAHALPRAVLQATEALLTRRCPDSTRPMLPLSPQPVAPGAGVALVRRVEEAAMPAWRRPTSGSNPQVNVTIEARGGAGGSVFDGNNAQAGDGGNASMIARGDTPTANAFGGAGGMVVSGTGTSGRAGDAEAFAFGTSSASATASGASALAHASSDGGSSPLSALASSSGGLITLLEGSTNGTPAGGTSAVESRTSVGDPAPGLALAAGLQGVAFGTGLPSTADAARGARRQRERHRRARRRPRPRPRRPRRRRRERRRRPVHHVRQLRRVPPRPRAALVGGRSRRRPARPGARRRGLRLAPVPDPARRRRGRERDVPRRRVGARLLRRPGARPRRDRGRRERRAST